MKILNLYAGIGGNRKFWGNEHEIVSIELDQQICAIYRDMYPSDLALSLDAHEYLLNNYDKFDFIWSSPPCPSHGQYRHNVGVKGKGFKAVYPDMKLYEEIILLKHHFKGKWVVENTISYYQPLIQPQKIGRHYFWANFQIPPLFVPTSNIREKNKISDFDVDLSKYKASNKRQILRNCVDSELGKHVFNAATGA